jgi:hypothetical protein
MIYLDDLIQEVGMNNVYEECTATEIKCEGTVTFIRPFDGRTWNTTRHYVTEQW